MLKRCAIPLLALGVAAAPVYAAETTGSIQFGYVATSGNSETTSTNAKLELGYKSEKWEDTLKLSGIGATQDDNTTQERYTGLGKAEYNFSEHNYVFGAVDYTKDLFGGVRERISETAGYGRRLVNQPKQSLDVEIGGGFRQTQEQKPSLERHNNGILRSALDYQYDLTDTSSFEQTLTVESGSNNTYLQSVTSLKLTIIENLFAQLSYTVDYNTHVTDDLKKTDTYTAISIGYAFDSKS